MRSKLRSLAVRYGGSAPARRHADARLEAERVAASFRRFPAARLAALRAPPERS